MFSLPVAHRRTSGAGLVDPWLRRAAAGAPRSFDWMPVRENLRRAKLPTMRNGPRATLCNTNEELPMRLNAKALAKLPWARLPWAGLLWSWRGRSA